MSIITEIKVNKIMLFVSQPVADLINDWLGIVNELDCRIIKDETELWFIEYDKEGRELELDENEKYLRNHLNKQLISNKYSIT